MPALQRSTITQAINGRTYTATRVIEGTRKLRQHIIFGGRTEHDSKAYSPAELAVMDATASLILWQLVTRGWPGQSPLEPPAGPDGPP